MHTNYALFEGYDETQYTKIFFDAETCGFVVAHKEHGKKELKGNKTIGYLVNDFVILPQVNFRCMETKLTLNVNSRVVERAKEYAQEQGVSVSKIVEDYLLLFDQQHDKELKVIENEIAIENEYHISKILIT